MPSGSCFCNKVKVTYTGDPLAKALCHCQDCKKISGSVFSNNIILPKTNFTVDGDLKQISKTAESGKKITNHFCPECGTTIYRDGESFGDNLVLKVGIVDDPNWLNENVPGAELFAPQRAKWTVPVEGAAQLPGMPPH